MDELAEGVVVVADTVGEGRGCTQEWPCSTVTLRH